MIRQKDFTYDPVNFKGLPEFVRSIKKNGLRYIIILVSVIMNFYPQERNCPQSWTKVVGRLTITASILHNLTWF